MSCSNPMLAVKTSIVNPRTGKNKYKFYKAVKNLSLPLQEEVNRHMREYGEYREYNVFGEETYGFFEDENGLYKSYRHDRFLVDPETGEVLNRAVLLPCGQCLECRTRYAAQWADRIVLEARYHEQSYFITLTYADEFVPPVVDQNGNTNYTLRPDDLRDFIKRFREHQFRKYGVRVRFYAVGEYGSRKHRPHYHIIVFGAIINDIRDYGKSAIGTPIHTSDEVLKIWQKKGRVEVEPLTWETACYTARYTVKKLGKIETDFYEKLGIIPEFTRMSNRPGIGARYLEDNMERIYKSDEILIPTSSSVRHSKPPYYYDDKYDLIFPEQMEHIKQNRRDIAVEEMKLKLDRFSGNYLELLANEHEKFINNKPNVKRRNLE